MNNKFNLTNLKVRSFVTSITNSKAKTILGGSPSPEELIATVDAQTDEATGMGASCEYTSCNA